MAEADQDAAAPQRIDIHEFSGHVSEFLERVRSRASFVIASQAEAVALLQPPRGLVRPPRRPGALKGQIRMSPDFDTLPPEVLAAIEGREAARG
ncbi:type II toxin-antitoxin system Phd/YefM family antitoxin [Methylobacterium oryzihabitans]|uniref:Prevent-host-death protein n=1 Tax=Methylobacterium oryzihabitans TaxID=2499852 RepID=A0A3S2VR11_9HYPH|nr:prevent-host-death protein [Methylobacterium oryzihabitans]RVU15150.1 prevent-host-death protein [Methylobacterium oryzihabitans]